MSPLRVLIFLGLWWKGSHEVASMLPHASSLLPYKSIRLHS